MKPPLILFNEKENKKYSNTLPFILYKFNWKTCKSSTSIKSVSNTWLSTQNTIHNQHKMTKYNVVKMNDQGQVSVQLYHINYFDVFVLSCMTSKFCRKYSKQQCAIRVQNLSTKISNWNLRILQRHSQIEQNECLYNYISTQDVKWEYGLGTKLCLYRATKKFSYVIHLCCMWNNWHIAWTWASVLSPFCFSYFIQT